jgi:protein gp37
MRWVKPNTDASQDESGTRAVWTGKVRLDEKSLDIPPSWAKPRKVFVNSMSDLFHLAVPATFICRV